MTRTTSPIWNLWVFIVDPPVAAPPARAARTSRGARAPRAPRTSAGAAPTLRAARAAARRPRRESIRLHPSSLRTRPSTLRATFEREVHVGLREPEIPSRALRQLQLLGLRKRLALDGKVRNLL